MKTQESFKESFGEQELNFVKLIENKRYDTILTYTNDYKEPLEKLSEEIRNENELKYEFLVQEKPKKSATESIMLPIERGKYSLPDAWEVVEDELDETEIPENLKDCQLIKDIQYGHPVSGGEIRDRGYIKYGLITKDTGEVKKLYFGSKTAKNHFKHHLNGRTFLESYQALDGKKYETYNARLSEVHRMVFDFFRWQKLSREKLKEFSETRGWHQDKIKNAVFEYVKNNDFGNFQLASHIKNYFTYKDVDTEPIKELLENFTLQKALTLANAQQEEAAVLKEALNDFSLEDLLGLAYIDIEEKEFKDWAKRTSITYDELVDTNWLQIQFGSGKKDFKKQGRGRYVFNAKDVVRIPFYDFNDKNYPIILWRNRNTGEKAKKQKYTSYPENRALKEERFLDRQVYRLGISLEPGAKNPLIKNLVIIEGEFKGAIGQLFAPTGTYYLSIPGITQVTPEIIKSIKNLNPEQVTVVFDADTLPKRLWRFDEKTDSERAAREIAESLKQAGSHNAKICDWIYFLKKRLKNTKEKLGLDDLILKYDDGPEKANQLLEEAKTLEDYSQFLHQDTEKVLTLQKGPSRPKYFDPIFEDLRVRRKEIKKIVKDVEIVVKRGGEVNKTSFQKLKTYYELINKAYSSRLEEYEAGSPNQPPSYRFAIFQGIMPDAEKKQFVYEDGTECAFFQIIKNLGRKQKQAQIPRPIIFAPFVTRDIKQVSKYEEQLFSGPKPKIPFILEANMSQVQALQTRNLETLTNAKHRKIFENAISGFKLLWNEDLEKEQAVKRFREVPLKTLYLALLAEQLSEDFTPDEFTFIQKNQKDLNCKIKKGEQKQTVAEIPLAIFDKNNFPIMFIYPVMREKDADKVLSRKKREKGFELKSWREVGDETWGSFKKLLTFFKERVE